ncbi:MAG TPA: protein-glutamate O-methyltransferase CheR [Azospirillaceae bacterium]|nr:protein-glutamate O-methyltransferase CheR [Azospirillaceae bacterium]
MRETTPISPGEFAKFQEFFYRKTGLLFTEAKRYFVDRRLAERMQATGSASFRDYFTLLRFQASGTELQALVNLMTVNETYFYREQYQFKCLVDSMLDEVARTKKPGRPIRIWSVPCATGEEPYTLAIHLLEHWAQVDAFEIEILASDIDTAALDAARAGIYAARAVQYVPMTVRRRYFTELGDDRWQIIPELRRSIEFTRVNLHDRAEVARNGRFDVIFCRNLLIYFDEHSRRQAAESFFDVLYPGGFIGLGHSESMSRISSLFNVRRFPDAIVYQKPR